MQPLTGLLADVALLIVELAVELDEEDEDALELKFPLLFGIVLPVDTRP